MCTSSLFRASNAVNVVQPPCKTDFSRVRNDETIFQKNPAFMVVIGDDIALEGAKCSNVGRRGLAGAVLIMKVKIFLLSLFLYHCFCLVCFSKIMNKN